MTNSDFPRRAALAFVVCVLPALVVLARADDVYAIKGAPASFTAECSTWLLAHAASGDFNEDGVRIPK
jgi:hypothetical protein